MKWEKEKSIISRRNIFCSERYGLNIAGLVKYFSHLVDSHRKRTKAKSTRRDRKRQVAVVAM